MKSNNPNNNSQFSIFNFQFSIIKKYMADNSNIKTQSSLPDFPLRRIKGAKKKIFAIIGSASSNSSNLKLVNYIAASTQENFEWNIFDRLKELPHFNPELSISNPPVEIINFRETVLQADGIIICTPEYVFSIPSGLKNAIEWCVATTVFSKKLVGLITASANGAKGHEELKLIIKTVYAKVMEEATLLIQGIKGRIDEYGNIIDANTVADLNNFIKAYKRLIEES